MNNKLLNSLIVITLIIILIILGLLTTIFIKSKTQNQNIIQQQDKKPKEIVRVQNRNDFFAVANCVEKYITNLTTKEKEILYAYLDEEYKAQKGITVDNILSYINTFDDYYKFKAREMYVCELEDSISQYYVYGTLTIESTGDDEEETPFYITINLDKKNNTFSVIPEEKEILELDSIFKQPSEMNYDEIRRNTYNKIDYTNIYDQQICNIYLMDFKGNMIKNPEKAYEQLDEDYRKVRYGNIENFKEYINKNKAKILEVILSKYEVKKGKTGNQYICIDQYENYYIFKETAIMQYSVSLDTYTVDSPEFIEKYNQSNYKNKVLLNIQKINEALNKNDFKYIYDKLDPVFKQNNFSDFNKFINYLKSKLFEKNEFKINNIERYGEVYASKVIVNNTKKMDVIMQLLSDTNFYISFSIEE